MRSFLGALIILIIVVAALWFWFPPWSAAPVRREPAVTATPDVSAPPSLPPTATFSPAPSPPPPAPSLTPLPRRVLLDVPFMTQAPTGSWAQPYQDACEEAAILMAHRWVAGKSVTRQEANTELLKMIAFENKLFGDYRDTTAAETVELFRKFYGSDAARLVPRATLADVKRELVKGNLVILPMAGRQLSGPYYTPPGPLYHMLLFRGYDEDRKEFIVNDDGTNTKGEAFRFSYAAIERSWNDWDQAVGGLAGANAPKPMIVVSR